ncbi:MAG: hypothetical protein V3R29_05105 [Candidatus Acidoferrales bacterium]
MGKMITVRQVAYGKHRWNEQDEARIERNLFAMDGETWEGLRFCKYRNGRHNRVHLVITEDDFVELFGDAVSNGVFHEQTLTQLRSILSRSDADKEDSPRPDPLLRVMGIGADGKLSQGIEEQLYGDDEK